MAITLADIFGNDISVDFTDPSNPILSFNLASLQNLGTGVGEINDNSGFNDITQVTAVNVETYASSILWGLIKLHIQNQPDTNNDETDLSYVEDLGVSTQARNSVSQLRYSKRVSKYETLGNDDLDNIS